MRLCASVRRPPSMARAPVQSPPPNCEDVVGKEDHTANLLIVVLSKMLFSRLFYFVVDMYL